MEALAVEMTVWQCISTAGRGVMQGFPPLELKLHSYSICCIIRTCGEKLHVPVALSLLYFCAVNTRTMQSLCFFASLFGERELNYAIKISLKVDLNEL